MPASDPPEPAYQPNSALAFAYDRFFRHIEVDPQWVDAVRQAEKRGRVVYVLRNRSLVDFLALDHLVKRLNLPPIRFAQDIGLWALEPFGSGLFRSFLPKARQDAKTRLQAAFEEGGSGVLFLKRPPNLLDHGLTKRAGPQSEGDASLRALIEMQRASDVPILLMPQVFVWTKRPDKKAMNAVDVVFGPREWPGKIRTTAQFLRNYRNVIFRAGEPLDLQQMLLDEGAAPSPQTAEAEDGLVRRITYALLTGVERERRAIVGPAKKPADRVRLEVLRSPKLQKTINALAGEGEEERLLLNAKAYRMIAEMEALPETDAHRAFEVAVNAIIQKVYAGVEVDKEGLTKVRDVCKRGTVVFLPSHKSHFDYLMLSYVLQNANLQLPLIAAGDNLAFFPMGPLFRRGGAFFIRRSFRGDRLYGAVVDAYLRRLVKDGWALEFFLEGGRSRTGKLLPPKFGLLNMVCEAALAQWEREVHFVPVSIGYERLLEENAYVREMAGGEKPAEDAGALLRATSVLQGYYGRVNVQFGEPLSIEGVCEQMDMATSRLRSPAKRRAVVQRLGHLALAEINRVTSVTAGSLVATLFLAHEQRGIPHETLVSRAARLASHLRRRGARLSPALITPSGTVRPAAIREAALLFVKGDLVDAVVPGDAAEGVSAERLVREREDVIYRVKDDARVRLSISRNVIVHLFVNRALLAIGVAMSAELEVTEKRLRERVRELSKLFKYEFMFRADGDFDTHFDETLAAMLADGELERKAEGVLAIGPGHDDLSGAQWLQLYRGCLVGFVEGYVIAARATKYLRKGPLSSKELTKKTLVLGQRMFLAGDVTTAEAINRPLFDNAWRALADQDYLKQEKGKYLLAPSFAHGKTLAVIETKVSAFLRSYLTNALTPPAPEEDGDVEAAESPSPGSAPEETPAHQPLVHE